LFPRIHVPPRTNTRSSFLGAVAIGCHADIVAGFPFRLPGSLRHGPGGMIEVSQAWCRVFPQDAKFKDATCQTCSCPPSGVWVCSATRDGQSNTSSNGCHLICPRQNAPAHGVLPDKMHLIREHGRRHTKTGARDTRQRDALDQLPQSKHSRKNGWYASRFCALSRHRRTFSGTGRRLRPFALPPRC
jgi:hypothetical protein